MNKDCGIVRDLMPLVIDEVAGNESKEFVETHLTGCEECKKLYQEMKADLPVETEKEEGTMQKAFSAAAEKLKKKRRVRTLKHILLGVLITSLIFGAGAFGYNKLTQTRKHIYYGSYRVFLSKLNSGNVVFTVDYNGSYDDLAVMVEVYEETDSQTEGEKRILEEEAAEGNLIMYVYMDKPIISKKLENPIQNHGFMALTPDRMAAYTEIRQGVPDEYQTIWRKGDPIGKASEQMEEYYFWYNIEEQIWIDYDQGKVSFANYRLESIRNEILQQISAIAPTVPEWQPWTAWPNDPPEFNTLDQETIKRILSDLRDAGITIDMPNPYESEEESQ